ncbi:MAG: tetratricopeptide repeat protein [Maribacter sp.]|nr:tetratricopeptide repeat protein [Maribacter sp.]
MRTYKYVINLCIVIVFFQLQYTMGYAQDQRLADSLEKIYQENRLVGVEKLELLRNLAFNENNDLELSLKYADELISLAKQEQNDIYLYRGYYIKGQKHRFKAELAIAQDAFFKGAEAATKADYIEGEGASYIAIADVYSLLGNAANAEQYYNQAIELLRKTTDSIALATALLNTGEYYFQNKKYDLALNYFDEAGPIFKDVNYSIGTAYYMGNEGMVYAKKGNDSLAEANLTKAIAMLEELSLNDPICEYLIYLSDIYLKRGLLDQALFNAKKSLGLAIKYGLKERIAAANLQLSKLYEHIGNWSEALRYYKDHVAYRDSVNNINLVEQIADLRTNFEISKQQDKLDLLEKESELQMIKEKSQQNFIFAAVIAFICVVIMALGLLYRYIFIRKTKLIIEAEKNRSDNLLINILPEETAMELKQKGRVRAKKYESVTVLFTDFKGFTRYAENLTPEDLVQSVDFYFTKFDEIFERYGMEKIKTIGDSYMCSGGLHSHTQDHATKMVQAALEILQFVEEIKNSTTTELNFDIRIGINTGPIVAGVVGNKKFAYDIWGDTVNVASHMESNSLPGRINIAQNTYDLVRKVFDCEYRGEINVKNRGPMKMYFVNGLRDRTRVMPQEENKISQSLEIS